MSLPNSAKAGQATPGQKTSSGEFVTVDLPSGVALDELVIAYRKDGELHELAAMEPPVYGELRTRD